MPLKRFNYKISRQISCPYAGGVLASQWKWIKQLSLDTVYLFSEETWRGTHVMHRFKLRQTERPPLTPLREWSGKERVVRAAKAIIYPQQSDTDCAPAASVEKPDVNQVASRMREKGLICTTALPARPTAPQHPRLRRKPD